ncbi:DUF2066 domain-containing protein [Ensifer canadensis]|jgi:uncharacterized protein|nr:DUF2066 domain-containing protein [Ensifer canadensis]KQU81304.1 hypothetical protein ASD00_35320 [Ensifer sp. Root31]KQW58300.1 hypothetical protein ASD02_04555 [Ensifer sp. Root1252]KQW62256.1 hypothetical protein ASD03_12660 [Ensifer sp. Root127]KQY65202.1 hypothetical protein ASD52_35510 [Ensifer sp. Root142]KRC67134.1 hypothetical protein ASE32_08015 [Ensifer sp. Root231]KRC98210.1 hypothetical protein ASE47_03205 [Ensifer sp. Root258]PSS61737.1 DUF2066 domain-containing protein [Ens
MGRLAKTLVMTAAIIGLLWTGAQAADRTALYVSDAIVTGTGEQNRQIGFRECLSEVLVKVSGDFTLTGSTALAALQVQAAEFVASFSYRDRLEGVPIHDEQGTHDRPHDLTCRFDPTTIDPLLAKLGRKPWLSPRPTIAVLLAVHDQRRRFVLTRDGSESPYMADSLAVAAVPLALSVRLPDAATLTSKDLDFVHLSRQRPAELKQLATDIGAEVPLAGTLVWSDAARGWIADWRITENGREYRWQIRGVSFDEAFRDAMRGAARILSGNGAP